MKKIMIFYVFFSLIIGIFIYFFTVIEISNVRTNEAYIKIADEASESLLIDDFVRFSSEGFERIETFDNASYLIEVLHVKAFSGETEYHQLGIFVIPKENVKHATLIDDTNDQTTAYITYDDEVIYDASLEDNLGNYAVSVGIEQIGFYFYAFEFDQDMTLNIVLKDYDGQVIVDEEVEISLMYNADSFIDGYTDEELDAIINAQDVVQTTIVERLTIFILVDVIIGTIIYYVMKYLRRTS